MAVTALRRLGRVILWLVVLAPLRWYRFLDRNVDDARDLTCLAFVVGAGAAAVVGMIVAALTGYSLVDGGLGGLVVVGVAGVAWILYALAVATVAWAIRWKPREPPSPLLPRRFPGPRLLRIWNARGWVIYPVLALCVVGGLAFTLYEDVVIDIRGTRANGTVVAIRESGGRSGHSLTVELSHPLDDVTNVAVPDTWRDDHQMGDAVAVEYDPGNARAGRRDEGHVWTH